MDRKTTCKKVTRKMFFERVAARSHYDEADVCAIYNAIVAEMEDILKDDQRLMLTGFGSFYVNNHKGHPVQFGQTVNYVSDYAVVKFVASNVFNKKLRQTDDLKNISEDTSEDDEVDFHE